MTRHYQKRCIHCRITYACKVSGRGRGRGGFGTNHNNGSYCEDCYAVVTAALKEIPAKVKQSWELTDEVTVEQIDTWWKEVVQKREKEGHMWPHIHRVASNLYDTENPSNINKTWMQRSPDGEKHYRYDYWTASPEDAKVYLETETDLTTGTTRPWRNFK